MSKAVKLAAKPLKDGQIPLRPSLARRMQAHDDVLALENVPKAISQYAKDRTDD